MYVCVLHAHSTTLLPVVPDSWDHWGNDLTNRRWNYNEKLINRTTVATLAARWTFLTGADVSATPTIVNDRLYVPDWNGNLYCLSAATGSVIWQRKILDYVLTVDPNPTTPGYTDTNIISRTSPAVSGQRLVIGVMKKGGGFPYLIAVSITDGSFIWGKRVDPHPYAIVTQVGCSSVYTGPQVSPVNANPLLSALNLGNTCLLHFTLQLISLQLTVLCLSHCKVAFIFVFNIAECCSNLSCFRAPPSLVTSSMLACLAWRRLRQTQPPTSAAHSLAA
jgi:hypothetical protein